MTWLLALSQLVPSLLRFAGKDNEAAVADRAVAAAKVLTGHDEPQAAIDALKASPELLLQFQKAANEIVIAELDAEIRAIGETNATMRAEMASADPFVRRARPAFIWAMAISWSIQSAALGYVAAFKPEHLGDVINAIAALTGMWSVALAVCGVYFKVRSDDKKTAAGAPAPTALESITGMFRKS